MVNVVDVTGGRRIPYNPYRQQRDDYQTGPQVNIGGQGLGDLDSLLSLLLQQQMMGQNQAQFETSQENMMKSLAAQIKSATDQLKLSNDHNMDMLLAQIGATEKQNQFNNSMNWVQLLRDFWTHNETNRLRAVDQEIAIEEDKATKEAGKKKAAVQYETNVVQDKVSDIGRSIDKSLDTHKPARLRRDASTNAQDAATQLTGIATGPASLERLALENGGVKQALGEYANLLEDEAENISLFEGIALAADGWGLMPDFLRASSGVDDVYQRRIDASAFRDAYDTIAAGKRLTAEEIYKLTNSGQTERWYKLQKEKANIGNNAEANAAMGKVLSDIGLQGGFGPTTSDRLAIFPNSETPVKGQEYLSSLVNSDTSTSPNRQPTPSTETTNSAVTYYNAYDDMVTPYGVIESLGM